MLKRLSITKIQEYLFYVFIFLLPWQTRWIFRDYQIDGQVFEYGRLSLYGFDIILIVIMAILLYCHIVKREEREIRNQKSEIRNQKSETRNQKPEIRRRFIFIFLCFYILLVLIFGAHEKIISLYWLGRFLLGAGLFGAVQQIEFSKLKLALVVTVTGFIQGLLAIWQFANQSIWSSKWLGMASQKVSELGASVIEIGGDRYLRAYGSWPHPNILGGFLVLILGAWFYLLTQAKERQQKRFVILTGIGIAAGIFFSFSRASWLVFLILYMLAWFYVGKYRHERFDKKALSAIGLVVVVFLMSFAPLVGTRMGVGERQRLEIRSEEERLSGYGQAIEIIKNNWWGVGMGNYAFAMRDYYKIDDPWEIQPVHNIYLMIWAELGAMGFLFVILLNCYIIKLLVKRKGWWDLGILMIIYGLMLFDHFWWTTASGMYIWWLVMGLGYKEGRKEL